MIFKKRIKIKLKRVDEINTSDILYDKKLKEFLVYPQDVDANTFDVDYIRKNCLRLIS